VNARGEQLRSGLHEIVADNGLAAEVRGPGLMIGLELGDPAHRVHDSARIGQIVNRCRDDGHLLLMNAGTYGNVVRFMPPLVVSEPEMQRAIDVVASAVAATA
jgi:4-aminobutyrate aminotransferase